MQRNGQNQTRRMCMLTGGQRSGEEQREGPCVVVVVVVVVLAVAVAVAAFANK